MNTILVKTDMTATIQKIEEPVYMTAGKHFRGFPEVVRGRRLPKPFCMLIDDNGHAKGLVMNMPGSYFYESDVHGNFILGDVYFLKEVPDTEGGYDITGLTGQELDILLKIFEKELGFIPDDER